jgi:hypothetical protein
MFAMTPTYDEPDYLDFGQKALFGEIRSINMQRTPITAFNAIFKLIIGEYSNDHSQISFFAARVPTVLAGILLGCYIVVWSRTLYGTTGSFLSLIFFVFCPNIIAHARLITSDIYCTLFMFMFVFHFTSYLHFEKIKDYLLAILTCSLAILSKQTAVLLFPIAALTGFIYIFYYKGCVERFNLKKIVFAACCVIFIINTAYGFYFYSFSIQNNTIFSSLSRLYIPLPQVFVDTFLLGVEYNKNGWPAYIIGRYSVLGWWYYFPILFILKMPIAYLILLFIQISIHTKEKVFNSLDEFSIIASPLIIILFFMFFCKVDIGIRYIIPALPFLFLITGRMGKYIEHGSGSFQKVGMAVLITYYVVSSLSFYPHFLQYGNEFIPRRIDLYKYFADSNLDWGQSDKYVARYIKKTASIDKKIYLTPDHPVEGIVIVNANALLDIFEPKRDKFAWLREQFDPIDHIAYNWLVFDTTDMNTRKSYHRQIE